MKKLKWLKVSNPVVSANCQKFQFWPIPSRYLKSTDTDNYPKIEIFYYCVISLKFCFLDCYHQPYRGIFIFPFFPFLWEIIWIFLNNLEDFCFLWLFWRWRWNGSWYFLIYIVVSFFDLLINQFCELFPFLIFHNCISCESI